jgi:hypothetical protein
VSASVPGDRTNGLVPAGIAAYTSTDKSFDAAATAAANPPTTIPTVRTVRAPVVLLLALVAAAAPDATAQAKPSEHGVVSQTVAGTTITIEYDRPVARGRDSLFGKVVKLEQLWTPGANWATTIEVDRDVHLDGHAVPAGKYSIWMIPRDGDWTVVLNRTARRFHSQKPDSTEDLVRFTVRPQQGPHAEVLTGRSRW